MITKEQFLEWLEENDACNPAQTWAETQPSVQEVWDNCERGDWLLWLLAEAGYSKRELLLLTCDLVRNTPTQDGRTVWDLMTDERSRNAIVVAEKFARKEATIDELRAAARAAADAAVARAAVAADAAAARAAVAADARAAAWAADAAADAAAVGATAWQADHIRSKVSWAEVEQLLSEACGGVKDDGGSHG